MYVIAKHRITDAERFFSLSQVAAEKAPAGVYGRQFCPSQDRSEAVCLWEAESLEAVESYLDALIGEAGVNTYFQVSTEHAVGIPERIIGADRASGEKGTTQQVSFEAYGTNGAEDYERYFVPLIPAPLAAEIVDRAALRPGERVVDVACGTGVVTRLAAERVGAGGTVAGVDINPGMLAVARTAAHGDATTEWYEANAEVLPFGDATFDVAFCQLGLQFFADKVSALREIQRVLTPGGRLLLSVPGPIPPILGVLEAALARHLGPEVAAFVQAVFSLDDPSEVRDLLTDAGFADAEVSTSEKTVVLPPPQEFMWQYVRSTPLAAPAARLDAQQRAVLEAEFVAGCQSLAEDGQLVLRHSVTLATARTSPAPPRNRTAASAAAP